MRDAATTSTTAAFTLHIPLRVQPACSTCASNAAGRFVLNKALSMAACSRPSRTNALLAQDFVRQTGIKRVTSIRSRSVRLSFGSFLPAALLFVSASIGRRL
jgi:hypothetical protein